MQAPGTPSSAPGSVAPCICADIPTPTIPAIRSPCSAVSAASMPSAAAIRSAGGGRDEAGRGCLAVVAASRLAIALGRVCQALGRVNVKCGVVSRLIGGLGFDPVTVTRDPAKAFVLAGIRGMSGKGRAAWRWCCRSQASPRGPGRRLRGLAPPAVRHACSDPRRGSCPHARARDTVVPGRTVTARRAAPRAGGVSAPRDPSLRPGRGAGRSGRGPPCRPAAAAGWRAAAPGSAPEFRAAARS